MQKIICKIAEILYFGNLKTKINMLYIVTLFIEYESFVNLGIILFLELWALPKLTDTLVKNKKEIK